MSCAVSEAEKSRRIAANQEYFFITLGNAQKVTPLLQLCKRKCVLVDVYRCYLFENSFRHPFRIHAVHHHFCDEAGTGGPQVFHFHLAGRQQVYHRNEEALPFPFSVGLLHKGAAILMCADGTISEFM